MSTTQTLTTVNATGVALAKFDTVKFKVTVEAYGKNGPKAKDAARPAIEAVYKAIDGLQASGVAVDRADLKATTETEVNKSYDEAKRRQVPDGYKATFTLSFRCPDVDRASEIQDALSSIEGVQADPPDFKIKDLSALHKAALADAKAKADERFANECEILGLNRAGYALSNYNVRYDDSESAGARPMRAELALMDASPRGGAAPPKPIEIHAGQAKVQATLAVTYSPKRTHATRGRSAARGDNGGGASRRPAAATATG